MGNDQTKPVRALIDGKIAGGECLHSATGVLEEWRFVWVSGVLRGAAAGRGSAHFPVWGRCRHRAQLETFPGSSAGRATRC